ncbi:MAG TPA: hypothetical protein DCQ98_03455, partial [Planctomycetaceae bacterium]|nr:hypothetical protein [Planctomycetaceae bacterium]
APARPEPKACDIDTGHATRRLERPMSHGRASRTTRAHVEAVAESAPRVAALPDRPNQPEAKRRDQPR